MRIMTESEKAYVAGIMDGEGSIIIAKWNTEFHKGKRIPQYVLRTQVKMCDENVIKYILCCVGVGGFSKCARSSWPRFNINGDPSMPYRDIYQFSLSGRNVVDFLKQLYPYLIRLKSQADVAFKYYETVLSQGCRNKGLSVEAIFIRENLRQEIKKLNHSRFCSGVANESSLPIVLRDVRVGGFKKGHPYYSRNKIDNKNLQFNF